MNPPTSPVTNVNTVREVCLTDFSQSPHVLVKGVYNSNFCVRPSHNNIFKFIPNSSRRDFGNNICFNAKN